ATSASTFLTEGLRPSDSPTRALARRSAGSLRSRGSFAALTRFYRGFAPRTPLHALSLAAPPARSDRVARSRRSLASAGASPLGLPYTRSRSPLAEARLNPPREGGRGGPSRPRLNMERETGIEPATNSLE